MIELTLFSILIFLSPMIYVARKYGKDSREFMLHEPIENLYLIRFLFLSGISLFFISIMLFYL